MMSKLCLGLLVGTATGLNIVANGPTLKRKAATGASTVSMPSDKLAVAFHAADIDGAHAPRLAVRTRARRASHPHARFASH